MRCKACDKILSDIEMTVTVTVSDTEIDDSDMCMECISAAFHKHSYVYDKEYQVHSDVDYNFINENEDY